MGSDLNDISENLPEGWPELNIDDIVTGVWVEGKVPSSIAVRHYLAAMFWFFRKSGLVRQARELHRQERPRLIEVEQGLAEVRQRFLLDWKLYCVQPEGGVQ